MPYPSIVLFESSKRYGVMKSSRYALARAKEKKEDEKEEERLAP